MQARVLNFLRLAQRLARIDSLVLGRDRLSVTMVVFVVVIALFLRFALPWLDQFLDTAGVLPNQSTANRLSDYYPALIACFAVFQGGLFSGAIFGFALIDEKEDRTIKAMLVSPVPFSEYMLYRVVVASLVAYATVVFLLLTVNLAPLALGEVLVIALGASLTGPLATLFYAVYAENKVQAFAIAKFVGIAGWIILIGWFVAEPFQWLFGLFPPFLTSKAYWMALDGNPNWWIVHAIGIATQLGLIALLANRFKTAAYK